MALNFIFSLFLHLTSILNDDQPVFQGKNLNTFIYNVLIYPEYSRDNCLQGTVNISFKLNKQGRIYQSEVQKGFGTDLDLEALRVVRLTSGKWLMPANYDTLISMVLPVNFTLRDFKCEERSKDEINAAINAYQARKGMSEVIFNYYDKKEAGVSDRAGEMRIEQLKYQLGYDEKFIDRLLKQAQRKLKQEDFEGACEDFHTIRRLGSDKSASFIEQNCK
ncbi:MAG: TonB family protein [Daejeonella sp.]|uniref:TonB family protein n=1 Tax=Daejeonella sp. TaxID=2805397 RepID=UPI002732DDAE|nr:TonB family protein [Daejeonella sp.]MDP3467689.1 TonB family protein [Daejeonella sp.]